MPKNKVDKWEIMKKIIELGGKGEEITVYNMTKKLREIAKKLRKNGLDVEEETVRRCIKELEWLGILKLKEETLGKTGKPKKVYDLAYPVVLAKEIIDSARNIKSSTFFEWFLRSALSSVNNKFDDFFKKRPSKSELPSLALLGTSFGFVIKK